MFIAELILTAVGVSMDAFSVSICKGLGLKRLNIFQALFIALVFGGFQALMPFIGYVFVATFEEATQFQAIIASNASLVACILLLVIGCKMI